MPKQTNSTKTPSPKKSGKKKNTGKSDQETWEEYSSFHDSFTELLSYENSRRTSSDIWQLNYI